MVETEKTYRIFSIVAYDISDSLCFKVLLEKIHTYKFDYFYIRHNNDNNKVHYHIAIYLPQARSITYIAKRLGIENKDVNVTDENGKRYTLKSTIAYFVHYKNKDKWQYSFGEIVSNNVDLLNKYINIITSGFSESNELQEILLFIDTNRITCISDVLRFCVDNNYLKTYKKYSYTLNQIVKEYYKFL